MDQEQWIHRQADYIAGSENSNNASMATQALREAATYLSGQPGAVNHLVHEIQERENPQGPYHVMVSPALGPQGPSESLRIVGGGTGYSPPANMEAARLPVSGQEFEQAIHSAADQIAAAENAGDSNSARMQLAQTAFALDAQRQPDTFRHLIHEVNEREAGNLRVVETPGANPCYDYVQIQGVDYTGRQIVQQVTQIPVGYNSAPVYPPVGYPQVGPPIGIGPDGGVRIGIPGIGGIVIGGGDRDHDRRDRDRDWRDHEREEHEREEHDRIERELRQREEDRERREREERREHGFNH